MTIANLDVESSECVQRYGVTSWESSHHEPLEIALAQEIPDDAVDAEIDQEWFDVDYEDDTRAVDDMEERAPEERAMHIVNA